jgi:hypothetical protein
MKHILIAFILIGLSKLGFTQTLNTSPLPAGETKIGGHLYAGSTNEVWTSANDLYFNYQGNAKATHFWSLGGSAGKSILSMLNNGNVGIGTTSPTERLSVNGKIRAQEIKVETSGWPDYVFAKDYQLPSLQETEQHIKDKGHLLGIPSAEEVKANGIDLGEMNAKLLKKIEELTLLLIETDKKFESKFQAQEAEINKLKTKL